MVKHICRSREWDYQELELAYVADCGGNGGWTIYGANGRERFPPDLELPYFLDYLNVFGMDGWELTHISGGPFVKMQYDYRRAVFRRPRLTTPTQWEYLIGVLWRRNNQWQLEEIRGEALPEPIPVQEFLDRIEAEGWELVQDALTTATGDTYVDIVLKRPML